MTRKTSLLHCVSFHQSYTIGWTRPAQHRAAGRMRPAKALAIAENVVTARPRIYN